MSLFKAPAQVINSAASIITTSCVVAEEVVIEYGAAAITGGRIVNKSLLILEKELDKQLSSDSTESTEDNSNSIRSRVVRTN